MNPPSDQNGLNESSASSRGGRTDRPRDLNGLYAFYFERIKPLYNVVSADSHVPFGILTEIMACFDHVARISQYAQPEPESIDRAVAHLKRGSFDAYKLILKKAIDDYRRLCEVDTSVIDNGHFNTRLTKLIAEIRAGAVHARTTEGDSCDDWHNAFDVWDMVHSKIMTFYKEFYENELVPWARKKGWVKRIVAFGQDVVVACVIALLGWMLNWWIVAIR